MKNPVPAFVLSLWLCLGVAGQHWAFYVAAAYSAVVVLAGMYKAGKKA